MAAALEFVVTAACAGASVAAIVYFGRWIKPGQHLPKPDPDEAPRTDPLWSRALRPEPRP